MTLLLFLLLLLPVLGAVLAPFLRQRVSPLPSDAEIRRRDLQAQKKSLYATLRELEFDYHAGKLSEADYTSLRTEYEAQALSLLKELDSLGTGAPSLSTPEPRRLRFSPRQWHPALLSTAAVALVLLGTLGGYGLFRLTEDTTTPPLERRVQILEKKTAENPRDIPALLELGRLSLEEEQFGRAIEVYRTVLQTDPHNVEALSSLGLILTTAGHTDAALATLDRALATEPTHPTALWAKGLALYQGKQDYPQAISVWKRLLEAHPNLDEAPQIREWIQRAEALGTSPALPSATIQGTVRVAPTLRERISPEVLLFIIARQDATGPPLAVKKITRPTFPLRYTLGPGDVMTPGSTLTGEVSLIARLKKSGAPGSPEPGDMEGRTRAPVRVGSRQADILIDTLH